MAIIGTSGFRYRNRFRLTLAFKRWIANGYHAGALGALRRRFGGETACIVFILALVASLGTLAPRLGD